MIRSLRTGVTGLRSHQARMDVIGNNIANVNTTAFKRSRVAFGELLGQQMLGVGRMAGGNGINPATVGMGVGVSSIDQNWGQGNFEYTNIATDLAVGGDGFFVVKGGPKNSEMLTRAGDFGFNGMGQLVTSTGLNVQGWRFNDDGSLTTGALQDVMLDEEMTAPATESSRVGVGGNLSADAEVGKEQNISTVVYDSQGKEHKLVVRLEKVGINDWQITSAELAGDPNSTPLTLDSNSVQFDDQGNLTSVGTISLSGADWPGTTADDVAITLDVSALTQVGGSTTAVVNEHNGQPPGYLESFAFTPQGVLMLNFSNGEQKPLYQLALADVPNPNGLEQRGENLYSTTVAAGDLVVGRPGQEINAVVVSGALEMSNVDLANEFTDMIVTQRGYQANARVITTSDELLQEVVSLKR